MIMENEGLLYNESYQRTFRRGAKPSQTDNQKRKIFFILDSLVGIVGFILFVFSVLVSIRGGWSEGGIHDISSETKTALYMLSIFAMFTSAIGGFGAYTRWKTLIVTFSILSLMCLAFHCYVVYTIMNVQRNASRYMARAWWDKINDDSKVSIQDTYKCCGYLNIKDNAIISSVCPKETIETYTSVSADIKEPANVMKKDSYYKHYSSKIQIQTTAGTVSTVNNSGNNAGNTGNTANTATTGGVAGNTATTTNAGGVAGDTTTNTGGAADTTNDTNVGGAGDDAGGATGAGGDETGAGAGAGDDAGGDADADAGGELKRRQLDDQTGNDADGEGNTVGGDADTTVDNTAGDATGAGDTAGAAGGATTGATGATDTTTGATTGAANGNAGATAGAAGAAGATGTTDTTGTTNGATGTTGSTTTATAASQNGSPKTIDPSVPGGCESHLKPLVETKLKLIYIILIAFCIFYPFSSIMGYIYWKALRLFKEYDEFA